MCEISSGEETHSCQHTWSSLNYTQHMTECRLIHLCNSTETWWIISYEDEPRRTPHPSVRSFVYELKTGTKSVASLPQVPNTPFPELHNEENRDEVQVRLLSQCLKTLPASAEPTPHPKLKPAKFSRITLLYNGWDLSLITGLFFPDKPMVIIDKSGCPLTPTQFKAHPNPVPFSRPEVNLCSCQVYTPFVNIMSRVKKICFPLQPTHSILSPKASHLSQGKTIFQKALTQATYPCSDPWCCWTVIIHPLKKQKHIDANEVKF